MRESKMKNVSFMYFVVFLFFYYINEKECTG